MPRYNIEKFEIQDAGNNNIVILVTGPLLYKQILQRAFHRFYFSRTFDDRFGRFDWGTYVYAVPDEDRPRIHDFLNLLAESICIEDDLSEAFALDLHSQTTAGGYTRTSIGQLVYQAKPYRHGTGSQKKANELADLMVSFIQRHPSYLAADVLVAVPPSNPNKPFDLPTHLVTRISARLDKPDASQWIRKVRNTRPMKDCTTIEEKLNNVRNAFQKNTQASFTQKTVLLVDDIYQSGFTMNEVGRTIFSAGATQVFGLAATKTFTDV